MSTELNSRERSILDLLEEWIRKGKTVSEAADAVAVIANDQPIVDHVVKIRQSIADERQNIAMNSALVDPEDAPQAWYTGPAAEDEFWPSLKKRLELDNGWASAVESLDDTSTDIVGLLSDPLSPKIDTRGLVIGYVQSGKTANFTATIAKAADAGYRLFIVLSGVHNALRRQTQLRLDQELCEPHQTKWLQLTDESSDFGNPVKALALVAGTDLKLLAVVKKNVSRLTRLRDWLMQAHESGGLDRCPVLIIDDESDQASPNSSRDPDLDRTKINQRIVELLHLPRVAYIGYTATPFANVLINPADHEDIYPRSFIYALPKAAEYFGSEELFGLNQDEPEEDTTEHDMIRFVPEAEAVKYKPTRGTKFEPTVTQALVEAIRWFILATAARRVRNGVYKHSSMLVHTTMRVDPQISYLHAIRDAVKVMRQEWDRGEVSDWRTQWESEVIREPASSHNLVAVTWEQLSAEVLDVISSIRCVADNSQSTERLIYTDEPATVIAVGGNTLSRGLTLEGLVSSFFLRSSGTYDSLLQMGRWFGYRPGYGDLPRIWTTKELANDFRFLAEVERSLRQEVSRYQQEGASPRELPVRIQMHHKMKVTAATKMRFAVPSEASYSGQRPQTTYFHHRNRAETLGNYEAAAWLLRTAQANGAEIVSEDSRTVLMDVPSPLIISFIERYTFHPQSEMNAELLVGYIKRQIEHAGLVRWNIAVMSRKGATGVPTIDLGFPVKVPLITRSKLRRSSDHDTANIGTLMSKPDRICDLVAPGESKVYTDLEMLDMRTKDGRGLLLIYPIDKTSVPRKSADNRMALDAVDNLIGVAFSFPKAIEGSESKNWLQVDPDKLRQLQTNEADSDEVYVDDEGSRDEVDLGNG